MGLSGCYAIMKYLVFFLNFTFWISGLCLIIVSSWMLIDPTFYISLAQNESSYYSATYLLLAVGILLFIAGLIGCCGTLRESQFMLILYFGVLVIILVAEISAAVWAYSNSEKLEDLVVDTVKTTVKSEYNERPSRTQTFDSIQSGLLCCGAEGPGDWAQSRLNGFTGQDDVYSLSISAKNREFVVPASCCVPDIAKADCEEALRVAAIGAPISPLIFHEGCTKKLLGVLNDYAKIFLGIGFAIGLAQLLALIFALVLCCALQRTNYKR